MIACLVLLTSLVLLAFFASDREGRVATIRRPSGPQAAGLLRLPVQAQGPVSAALGADSGAYDIVRRGGLRALNPAQRLDERFTSSGVSISSRGLRVGLGLRALGYGATLHTVPVAPARARGNRVSYAHPGISEWFANGPLGLEQGFDIPRAPAGQAAKVLTLSIALSGNAQATLAPDGKSVTLARGGDPQLRYDGLVATDARGHALRSWLQLRAGELLLRVDTTGARYPLRIDPLVQDGAKLTAGSGGEFGYSVALSKGGERAVIGAPAEDGEAGAAWVFTHDSRGWVQEGEKLTPGAGEEIGAGRFGQSVALSSGGRVLIGAPGDDGSLGAVWAFARPTEGGTWTQQGSKITPKSKEESGSGGFGYSVAASGTRAIVAAPADNSGTGAVWRFKYSSRTKVWAQEGTKLKAKSGEEIGAGFFGASVALANTTALIGAPGDQGEVGAAWVFVEGAQHGGKLTGEGEIGAGQFGRSVALSSKEANTAAIGGPNEDGEAGAAWIFIDSGGTWEQQGEKLAPALGEEAGAARFGEAVALSGSGDTVLVGAGRDNGDLGAAWEFARSNVTWEQEGTKLTGDVEESGKGGFGSSVALSSTGDDALIGAPSDDAGKGAAWPFAVELGPVPVDITPPTISADVKEGDTIVLTHGSWEHSPIEYSEQWLRCNASGGACEPIAGASEPDYVLSAADVGHELRVQEIAINAGGESEPAQSAASAVVTASPLAAVPGEDVRTCVGQEVGLDGSGSTPSGGITSYEWEFGDSTSAEGASVSHAYSAPGKYTATLTVHRGGEQNRASITVEVASCSGGPEVTVTVENEAHEPLEKAAVLFDPPNDERNEAFTNASGDAVLLGMPAGTDVVYVYESGYQPAAVHVAVNESGEGEAVAILAKGEVAAVNVTSHEMTLKEIEEAGIDPNDPANQQVYAFEVKLAFPYGGGEGSGGEGHAPVELRCQLNSAEQLVGTCHGGFKRHKKSGGEESVPWECTSSSCELQEPVGGGGEEGGEEPSMAIEPVTPSGGPSGSGGTPTPAIQWLILHGRASVLKQFMEVSMGVVNLSPEEPFELVHNSATINLPAGVSLAPTPTPQSATQALPAIPPLGSASANWIVRGDTSGEYLLSAAFDGTLEPFEAPLHSLAALKTPFHVWGANALKLKVRADEGKYLRLTPYHVSLGMEDAATIPLYNVALSVDEEPHEHFIFQPRQQFSQEIGELKPKQTLYVKRPYELLACETSEGVFDPALSSATFVGEEEHPGEGIEPATPPPLYEVEAPTDTQNYVHLRWKKKAATSGYLSAEGYEVYSTSSCLEPFGSLPVMVKETPTSPLVEKLPATATEAYVPAKPGEALQYAVSTVIEGKSLQLEMPLVEGTTQAPPEWGRCTKVAAGAGGYSSSKCTTPGGKKDYLWASEALKRGATVSGAGAKLESTSKAAIACKGSSGIGTHALGKRLEPLTLTLTGCEMEAKQCSSPGAGAGEVRSNQLTGELVWESKAESKVALDIYRPKGGPLLSFECMGKKVEVRGSALAAIKTGKMAQAYAVKYKASKGLQKPSEYETALGAKVKDVLETSVAGGAFTQTGLTTTLTLTNEEPLQVDPGV